MRYKILIIFIFFALPFGSLYAQTDENDILREQIKAKEEEIKKLEAEEIKYKEALVGKQNQAKTLKDQIATIDNQIKRLQTDLKITQAKISKTESNINLHSRAIKEKGKEIKNRKSSIGETIRFLERSDNEGLLALILKSKKFSSFLSENQYLIGLQSGLYNNLVSLIQAKGELEELVREENGLKNELGELKGSLIIKNRLVVNQKQEKNNLLKETKNQEIEYQKIISKIQIRQAEIQKDIFELENKLRGEVGGVPKPRPGALAWPVLGRITQGYGPTSVTGFYNDAYRFHNGVDIAAYYGAPIMSSLDGIVAAVGDNGKYVYGKWVAVRHNNGLTTLYTHLSERTVNIGQSVRQGQIIGYEGSTGFVTGPHLHFTVYSTNTFRVENRWFGPLPLGGSINPFDYLL
ncbi:hypothetical protein A2567_00915 [Candidatus Azambacteria bacterium RIFOXYD1_FULL_42_11]|uniref:Peptidase, M23/M37 family n=3 Tax=Candidatus Azamiibacteriota TaxID=1752741 RepID=A0A0G1CAJ1_9BACT|nr:MAG: Peptidase, M23/M37 family [Candidatus Azambacteria bacterium GW2011_GWA1_42_19]KKS75823.1 MAG: Peptidase, M23/M37 family [Candidatus Azambacteria bacterium GW2011_GWA2_42_9]KKS88934.1 MAG: Peptidase, M23/M37 family [Parcubacteria group bacterium GW2011_GWC1_43_11]OGD41783.1 MAG: hypothetical protein A2567_00915 [Candidatus Azambacteria bacterium RIFOXYD1_FULL_42_11]